MLRFRRRLLSAIAMLCLLCIALSSPALAYHFVWITDTQNYSDGYPDTFLTMTDWIVKNRDALDIRFVFHTGDFVNASRSEAQWAAAAEGMQKLNGNIPYLATAGNHDVGSKYNFNHFYNYIDNAQTPQLEGGAYGEGRSRYTLFSAEGRDYIFLSIGFERQSPAEEEIQWINDILHKFSDRSAVLLTHSYLHSDGKRLTTQGNAIYNQIVVPNPNVWLILSGHCRKPATKTQELDDDGDGITDRKVYAVMANYQDAPKGGSGYLRLINFGRNTVCFSTYSPWLDDYFFFEKAGQDSLCVLYPEG